jgi:hypothetical protein
MLLKIVSTNCFLNMVPESSKREEQVMPGDGRSREEVGKVRG